jgi:hypothetical protein
MTITKSDLQMELQITFASGFSDAFFTELADYALSMLKLKTNRSTFTGIAVNIAKYGELCIAIDRLATSNRSIISSAISSISENGASISFQNGKTLESYRLDFNRIVNDLKLPSAGNYSITMPDIESIHVSTDGNPLY